MYEPRNKRVTRKNRRLGSMAAVVFVFATAVTGCHAPGRYGRAATDANSTQTRSVRPGINDPYKEPVVEEWVERFESESREIFRERRRIVEAISLRPGMTVADIGAGTGLFVPLFSEAVGPTGRLLAVDIVPEFLDLIRERVRERGLTNVQTVLCDEDSVRLPPGSIDVAFVCDTYHHFEYPQDTLASIHRALREGGQLVVIDFDRVEGESRTWVLDHVRAGKDVFIAEIREAGFALIQEIDAPYLAENFFLRFRRVP